MSGFCRDGLVWVGLVWVGLVLVGLGLVGVKVCSRLQIQIYFL